MPNRLARETSPYLRQHADNPVDWWPWNADALAAARAQDKPILLSIGYSACHWCHVMAHESFEDDATARAMNDKFICIKVDREERPDLDKIYQLAHQALTRRGGGWPLTVFLAPDDLAPFYAGTYFPKDARYGMPPFAYVLDQVRGFWDQRRGDVQAQNAALREFLDEYGVGSAHAGALDAAPIDAALMQIEESFDRVYGGHRGAPKFPHCAEMELLLDIALEQEQEAPPHPTLSPDDEAVRGEGLGSMVELTLARIADGGIHDQIGGGFCRYSVDERWEIPHFEKMLYDNAQLLPLYAAHASEAHAPEASASEAHVSKARASEAHVSKARASEAHVSKARASEALSPDTLHRRGRGLGEGALFAADPVSGLLRWLQREMTAPDGAFYAALDADSEHEEGKFYLWQRDDLRARLSDEEYAVAAPYFGFDRAPNFEHESWNPIAAMTMDDLAATLDLSRDEVDSRLLAARAKLFAARAQRVRPGLDDKILTAWNALMISGLARAAHTSPSGACTALAKRAIEFLYANAWRDGRLYAKSGLDAVRFPAYLDDYAFLLDALIEFLQSEWNNGYIEWAITLADALLHRFEDPDHGGFWFTAHDHEQLIQRPKPFADEAIPSGNGVAARALLRLGHLLGETRWLDAAERCLRAAHPVMAQMPAACATLQRALNDFLLPRTHIVVRVDTPEEQERWRKALTPHIDRRTDLYVIPESAAPLPGTLAAQSFVSGGVAYLCRGTHCEPPIGTPSALIDVLRA